MISSSGLVVWSATYESFGKAVIDPASAIENNLRFPGQYDDQETGLHYNWHRYYEPGNGRYLSADPIGFFGRDVNLYRYVLSDPINSTDHMGLIAPTVAGAMIGGTYIATVYGPHLYYKAAPYFAQFGAYSNRLATSAWLYGVNLYYQYAPVVGRLGLKLGEEVWGTGLLGR